FLDRAAALLGERPRVLSGEDEARATFAGALSGLRLEGEVAVLDVGGGSTEWVVGRHTPEGIKVRSAQSANVGSVRLTERFVHSDPPGRAERQAARAAAREAFASLTTAAPFRGAEALASLTTAAPFRGAEALASLATAAPFRGDEALASLTTAAPFQGALVGVAGTVTTFAALHAGQHPYDGARMHGTRLARADIEAALERVAALPLAERSQLPGLDPARADVIVAGGEVLLAALDWCGATSLHVSDRGVRWGLAAERAGLRRLDGRAG
nr:hypothetical protein [Polyangiaceae bacterium]